ncbi:hypothetical protein UlMin_034400 [Ulmus minor]
MENSRVVTIGELIQGGRPLTGSSSLRNCSTSSKSSFKQPSKLSTPPASTNPNPKVLAPLHYPAIIIGTLTLPPAVHDGTSSFKPTRRCSYGSCFQFSDGSVTICCDILDLDLAIIGNKIRVIAWNFIPIKGGGGFLEIISWSFLDPESGTCRPSNLPSFSLALSSSPGCGNSLKSRYSLHGALESISPISVVPSSQTTARFDSNASTNIRGFLVRILVCECKICSSKSKEPTIILTDSIQEQGKHSFTKPAFVYFCGVASSWHPVISKLIGKVVSISGLKKKLVYMGKEESCLMYLIAERSDLRLRRFDKIPSANRRTLIKGKGECGTYAGVVRGVYMQGMVVELENEVWLLLTDLLLTAPHSLRVGALISVRNVHFVNPKFPWMKMLILGSCYKTSITIKYFSPLVTGCHKLSQSLSMLGKFIESLAFPARLWLLLLASCFRKKFTGILSQKAILGSKDHGVFVALCKHDSCASSCDKNSGNLELVVPVSSFICHCESIWLRTLQLENNKISHGDKLNSLLLCERNSYGQSIKKIFSSKDIGIILIGSLKISSSSGRLQLVDATGSIDVLIPDLPSTWSADNIYEVIDYSLVIEGIPGGVDRSEYTDKPFSCRSIFDFNPLAREMNLTVYAYFHLQNATCRNFSIFPDIRSGEVCKRLDSGVYHLLRVTHKFPVLQKFKGDTVCLDLSSMFAEAVILSWDLFVAEKDVPVHATADPSNLLKKRREHCDGGSNLECISLKKCKIDHASSRALSGLVGIPFPCSTAMQLSACSNSVIKSSGKQSCCNLRCREISCSANIKGFNNHGVARSLILPHKRANSNGCGFCRPRALKVLLEFKPESFHKYQLLQIGCYYITKHDGGDPFCNFKDSDFVSGVKFLVPSKIHLWSLSFATDEVLPSSNILNYPPSDNCSSIGDEVSFGDQNEVSLHMFNSHSLETDIALSLPTNTIDLLKIDISVLVKGLTKPVLTTESVLKVSPSSGTVKSNPCFLPNSNCLLPEGNLTSLRGHVVAIHHVDHSSVNAHLNCQNLGGSFLSRFFRGVANTSCFHVLVDHQIVKIVGSSSKHAFPTGFGLVVDATFNRVLELGGQKRYMLTPASFIVINSIKVVNESCRDKCSSLASDISYTISSGLIFELVEQFDCKLMQVHCRVVTVNILVMENYTRDLHQQPKFGSRKHLVGIPIAGFVLDDGSTPCCCWANAERAAAFLRLNEELPKRAFSSDAWILKEIGMDDSACHTIMYHLERILENHDRIIVQNFGSPFESNFQELAVSASPDTLTSSDENFLKFVVLNASFGPFWTILASSMDSNTVKKLAKENFLEMEMDISFLNNIWAEEVHYPDPFTQSRNMIKELLDRDISTNLDCFSRNI